MRKMPSKLQRIFACITMLFFVLMIANIGLAKSNLAWMSLLLGKKGIVVYQYQNTTSTETDSNGIALLDTTSFNKQIQLEVKDNTGGTVGSVLVEYKQKDGKVEITVEDPSKQYAKAYYFSDLTNIPTSEFSQLINNDSVKLVAKYIGEQFLGFFIKDAEAILVSGPILIIGLGLTAYTSYVAAEGLSETFDFVIENHHESDIMTTTIRTTVGEFSNVIPEAMKVAMLPVSLANNILLISSGGATFKVSKAIDIGADIVDDIVIESLTSYLFHQLGEAVGEDTVIDVTFYHFAFLMNGTRGAISVEVVEPLVEIVMWQGREWQRSDDANTYTWENAKTYCSNLFLAGHSDWRLPTKTELKSLVVCSNGKPTPLADWDDFGSKTYAQNVQDATCSYDGSWDDYTIPTIDIRFSCHSGRSDGYWSSSVYDEDHPWGVSFYTGDAHTATSNYDFYVRCVR